MTPGDHEATSPRPQQGLSSRFQDFMRPGRQELLRSGVLDLWSSRVQELMISGHQRFLTSGDQDAKTSIRIDFLTSLFHDGLSSRFIHPISRQFCSDVGFGNGWFASSDWPANKRKRDGIFDPFLSPRNIICFGTRQAVFSVTRNRFRNRKQLARKGVENSSEVVAFYRAPRAPRPTFKRFGIFTGFTRKWLRDGQFLRFAAHKNKGNLVDLHRLHCLI